jgi:hypothetical protein
MAAETQRGPAAKKFGLVTQYSSQIPVGHGARLPLTSWDEHNILLPTVQ